MKVYNQFAFLTYLKMGQNRGIRFSVSGLERILAIFAILHLNEGIQKAKLLHNPMVLSQEMGVYFGPFWPVSSPPVSRYFFVRFDGLLWVGFFDRLDANLPLLNLA